MDRIEVRSVACGPFGLRLTLPATPGRPATTWGEALATAAVLILGMVAAAVFFGVAGMVP
jgi:hypothetical protein